VFGKIKGGEKRINICGDEKKTHPVRGGKRVIFESLSNQSTNTNS